MDIAQGKRLLSHVHGVTEIAHLDGDLMHVETRQDCTRIVEEAARLRDDKPGKDLRLVAVVPQAVTDQAYREGWLHDQAAWKKWMNDPDNKAFRVHGGRV